MAELAPMVGPQVHPQLQMHQTEEQGHVGRLTLAFGQLQELQNTHHELTFLCSPWLLPSGLQS